MARAGLEPALGKIASCSASSAASVESFLNSEPRASSSLARTAPWISRKRWTIIERDETSR
jgi:hypothetical protein